MASQKGRRCRRGLSHAHRPSPACWVTDPRFSRIDFFRSIFWVCVELSEDGGLRITKEEHNDTHKFTSSLELDVE